MLVISGLWQNRLLDRTKKLPLHPMGPHLTFHLAGGVGGIDHFLNQFAGPMASWWESLGDPLLTAELRERLAKGIADEVAGRGIADLEAQRDRFLVDLLALKAGEQ